MKPPVPMTTERLQETLGRLAIKESVVDWQWEWVVKPIYDLQPDGNGGIEQTVQHHLIAATFTRPDTRTGKTGRGRSRFEFIAPDATRDNVVKTAFVILKLTVEHELMEAFHYMGARIFNPHAHCDTLRRVNANRGPGADWEEGLIAEKPRVEEE